ncbi:MAG: hypothetical protein ACTSYX_04835 [Candidatus Thorarchaeota archaeon]
MADEWTLPRPIHRLPNAFQLVALPTTSRGTFVRYFLGPDAKIWEMTQAQRETWKNQILREWDKFKHVLKYDGTARHFQQLRDMSRLGGGVILISEQYGTGKSTIANTHLKLWQLIKYRETGRLHIPHVYWRKNVARSMIREAPPDTAHSIDEDMKATGTGSVNLEVHIQNIFETIRKTGKLVIEVGVNLRPSTHQRAVAIQIEPFGFNRVLQANRFIVKDYLGNPLWLAVTQRNYLPHERVYYEGELGTFGEYADRATAFSRGTTGVFAGTAGDSERQWKDELVRYYTGRFPGVVPTTTELEYYAIQLGIPPESTASIRRVCAVARREIKMQVSAPEEREVSESTARGPERKTRPEGWLWLRQQLAELLDCWPCAVYLVPPQPKMSLGDVCQSENLPILPDSLGKTIRNRRRRLPPKVIGDLGEQLFASWIDSLGPAVGTGSKNQPDVLFGIEGVEVAVNVKLTLSDSFRESLEVTPENRWAPNALVALLVPRRLQLRLFQIPSPETSVMTVNWQRGVLSTPDTLLEDIRAVLGMT